MTRSDALITLRLVGFSLEPGATEPVRRGLVVRFADQTDSDEDRDECDRAARLLGYRIVEDEAGDWVLA